MWRSYWFRAGTIGLALGTGPLVLAILFAALTGDRHANPIGPGMLAFLTFWPSVICLAIGALRARRQRQAG